MIDSLVNWIQLDITCEPIERMEETSLSAPPCFNFLNLGDDDPRDCLLIGESSYVRPPQNVMLHRVWPTRLRFFQCQTGRRLKVLIKTQTCVFHGYPSESWCFRLCAALMSSKPEMLLAAKRSSNMTNNELYFTHDAVKKITVEGNACNR